jgi:hypothetical protein
VASEAGARKGSPNPIRHAALGLIGHAALGVVLTGVTALVVILATVNRLDSLKQGLIATYFSDLNWSSLPVRSAIDSQPSTDSLVDDWQGRPPPSFSATWVGSLMTVGGGAYNFATVSDGGSWVYIDGIQVVDNPAPRSVPSSAGSVTLKRGVHEVFIKYLHNGSTPAFEFSWARDRGALEPVPSWALSARLREFPRSLVSTVLRRSASAASWLWMGTFAFLVASLMTRPVGRVIAFLRDDRAGRTLGVIVVGSLLLNVLAIGWGVPSFWMGDELTPRRVLMGLSQRFSGGWYDRYPPFHFYVLSGVFSPWLIAESKHWIHLTDSTRDAVFLILARLVSVVAGGGTLIGVYLCGSRAFGTRAGLFAAAMVALLSIFVFYAKSANPEVPYVFWFTLSLAFYLRFVQAPTLVNIVSCAAAATVAVCTKDQAYALYLSLPFVVVYQLWRSNRDRNVRHPLGCALLDRRLILAGVTAATLFIAIHNIPYNKDGVVRHVRDITSSFQPYRMVEPTAAGRFALLELTEDLNQQTWGWPLWIVSLIGLVVAVRETQSRRAAVCLVLIMVSYYVGFIDVILYTYDRYLLPICIVQALLGGVALDRFLRWQHSPTRVWRVGLVAAVFVYTALYAATVDALMIRDSRYTVEQWLRLHARADDLVGSAFPVAVIPRLGDFASVDLSTIEDLQRWAPRYFVLNADYARAVPADSPTGRMVAGLQGQTLGYRLAFRYRSPAPWSWLPWTHRDLAGPRLETPVASILRDVNPTIEVFQLGGAR